MSKVNDDHAEWSISAVLLDLLDPCKVFISVDHILKPETERGINGVKNHVVFPEGAVVFGESLNVDYGSRGSGDLYCNV